MSGLAVIFHRDGSPVDRRALEAMTGAIAHRGPDGICHWTSGPVGLGHCAHWLLPEDVGLAQPITSLDGQLTLTFDGRIDNRDELQELLPLPAGAPDARFVLAAYERWGESCPERLLGDFAFTLWDERQRHLFCARDIMGVRPFLYFLSDRLFLAGSERRQLFTHPSPTRTPNEPIIAALMMTRWVSQTGTIHRDVQRLAPATCLTMTATDVRTRRYWDIHETAPCPPRSDGEYAEEFWSTMRVAVNCRLRSRGNTGVLLSGGLDSTTVAAAMVVEKGPDSESSHTPAYSLGFPGWPEADETKLIRETHNYLHLAGRILPAHRRPAGGYADDVTRYVDLPDPFNDAFLDGIRQVAAADGARVLLGGLGGDEWFGGSPFVIADHLQQGRFATAIGEARSAARRRGLATGTVLWRFGLRSLAPSGLIRLRDLINGHPQGVSPWVHPEFARRTDLANLIRTRPVSSRKRKSQHTALCGYEGGQLAHMLELHERANAKFGIETRQPFLDRRLVTLGLGLPVRQCRERSVNKYVVRNAVRNRVPEAVRLRNEKAEFSQQLVGEIAANANAGFFRNSSLGDRGWLMAEVAEQMLAETLAQAIQPRYRIQGRLWNLFALELAARQSVI